MENDDLGLCPDPEICVSDYEYTFVQTLGVGDEDDYFANTCTLWTRKALHNNMHDEEPVPGSRGGRACLLPGANWRPTVTLLVSAAVSKTTVAASPARGKRYRRLPRPARLAH